MDPADKPRDDDSKPSHGATVEGNNQAYRNDSVGGLCRTTTLIRIRQFGIFNQESDFTLLNSHFDMTTVTEFAKQ